MHNLHMLYLPWTGRRMKRNLKFVINNDVLMIMEVNTEYVSNKITVIQLICSIIGSLGKFQRSVLF